MPKLGDIGDIAEKHRLSAATAAVFPGSLTTMLISANSKKKHDRRPKLDDDVVDRIRVMHEDEGWGYRRLARHFDTPRDTIRSLCKYRRR